MDLSNFSAALFQLSYFGIVTCNTHLTLLTGTLKNQPSIRYLPTHVVLVRARGMYVSASSTYARTRSERKVTTFGVRWL